MITFIDYVYNLNRSTHEQIDSSQTARAGNKTHLIVAERKRFTQEERRIAREIVTRAIEVTRRHFEK